MASMNNVPRDILDSMRDNLDRRVKLSIKRMVNYETRKEKFEHRVLAFSPYRLFIFTAKSPTKVESSLHYLDIESIESKKPNHLVITTTTKTYTFTALEADTEEINHMITHIGTSLKTVFPSVNLDKLIHKVEVQPSDRIRVMYDMMKNIGQKEMGPCGGFTHMYACMCDYHGLVYRDEVAWDVDTIYLSQDSRELCLRDFDHLKERDLVPIVSALIHNNWFTSLNANNVRLTQDVCNEILRLVKKNEVIESLMLSGTGIGTDFIKKLSTMSMAGTALHRLDLSNNLIDDIGAEHIFGSLSSRGKTFTMIDLSRTKVTSRGLNKVAEAMNRSPHVFSSLHTLKLAHLTSNKPDDMQNMYSFLASPNMLTHLDLTGTDFELDRLMTPLQRGCSQSITVLKLSKLAFTNKKTKDVAIPPSFKQFFSSVFSLKQLDLSGAKLPPEAVKDLLLGINTNRNIADLYIDISGIDLVSPAPQYLQNCLSNVSNVYSLNISNIAFQDQELIGVLQSIGQNKSIKQLIMGRVFTNVKPKNLPGVMDELVRVIQEDDAVLESLSLADSKLKDSMNTIINALGSNSSLTEIDISGNLMGDLGARMLSKALQINNKLKTIVWDKNCTGCQGFEDIAEALEKNYTLKKMPIPVYDASAALRTHPERTEQALQTIERLLQRNHSPQKYSSDQAYRLQQGFLISSTQQMVDRLVVQSQDTINALTMDSLEPHSADVEIAKLLIKDADKSKRLLPRLHDIANQSQNTGSPVEKKLKEISVELKSVLEGQIQSTVQNMLESTNKQCKTIMKDQALNKELQTGCKEKSTFPKDFTKNILDGVDTDIFNKLSELNLAMAAHISDRIIDEVIERLSKSHKTLTDHLNQKRKDVTRRGQSKKNEENETNLRTKDTGSPQPEKDLLQVPKTMDSPKIQSKRKSMHARKIRPQSVIDREQVQVALAQDPSRPADTKKSRQPLTPKQPKQPKPPTSGSKAPSSGSKAPASGSKAPASGSKAPKKPPSKSPNNKPEKKKSGSKLKHSNSTSDISSKPPLKAKKSSSASNSRSTSPLPKIEVTYENVGDFDLGNDPRTDLDHDPVYDNAVGVQARCFDLSELREVDDGLDADTDNLPEKPVIVPTTQDNEVVESFDAVPELSAAPKLSHATKNRPKRAKNVRPNTRQSALPASNNVKVDEDIDSFFTTSTTSIDSTVTTPNKSDDSTKPSSNKSTPETRKKSGGLFGFGSKEGKDKEKDKEQKKTGSGFSGLFKKSGNKPSPPPAASKNAHRISNVQEEDDDKSSTSSSLRRSATEDSSLRGSFDRKQSGGSINSASPRESLKSEKGSVKGEITPDRVSVKSGESVNTDTVDKVPDNTDSKAADSKAADVKQADSKQADSKAADVKQADSKQADSKAADNKVSDVKVESDKKPLAVPRTRTSFTKADNVKKLEDKPEVVNDKKDEDKIAEDPDKSKNEEKRNSTDSPSVSEDKESDVSDTKPEPAAPVVPKRPVAPGGLGFGINIMAEMKEKQKRKSMMPAVNVSPKPSPEKSVDQSPKQEQKEPLFGQRILRHSGDRDKKVPTSKQSDSEDKTSAKITIDKPLDSSSNNATSETVNKPTVTDTASKPTLPDSKSKPTTTESVNKTSVKSESEDRKSDRKSTGSEVAEQEVTKGTDKTPTPVTQKPSLNGEKPPIVARQGVLKPPITKPKPPANKPRPAPRTSLSQSEDTDPTSPDSSTKEGKDTKHESSIVYDSATLKMSVKDKIAKKFGNTAVDSAVKKEEKSPRTSVTGSPRISATESQETKPTSPDMKPAGLVLPFAAGKSEKSDVKKDNSLPRDATPDDVDKGLSLSQDDLQAGDLDLRSETSSEMTDSGIVYDSDTLKMSVKDKANSLFGETVQKKSGSLPRDTKPADMKEDTPKTSKRPRSMFAVIDNHPDLKNKPQTDKKTDIPEETSEDMPGSADTNTDTKTDDTDQHSPTDVVMV